jgi:hypothetical protein
LMNSVVKIIIDVSTVINDDLISTNITPIKNLNDTNCSEKLTLLYYDLLLVEVLIQNGMNVETISQVIRNLIDSLIKRLQSLAKKNDDDIDKYQDNLFQLFNICKVLSKSENNKVIKNL